MRPSALSCRMAKVVKILVLRVTRNTVEPSTTVAPAWLDLFVAAQKKLHRDCCEDVTSIATFVASNVELEKYLLSVVEMLVKAPARDSLEYIGGGKAKGGSQQAATVVVMLNNVIQCANIFTRFIFTVMLEG